MKDESTDDGSWFAGLKKQMQRLIAARKTIDGESFDQSANEIYLIHIKKLCTALSKANTAEAAARKLAIKTCWRAAGRAGEPAALSYSTLKWNELFECGKIESPQSKPSKMKHILFPAGMDLASDWMVDFGDNLVFQSRQVDHMNMVRCPNFP